MPQKPPLPVRELFRRFFEMTGTPSTTLLLILLAVVVPVAVDAQTSARFSVEPSEAQVRSGSGLVGEEFTFTAFVAQANCYRLDFGDGDSETVSGGESGAVFGHRYETPNRFTARMRAWRTSDCSAAISSQPPLKELPLRIRVNPLPVAATVQAAPPPIRIQLPPREIVVQAPRPEISEQWPRVRPAAPVSLPAPDAEASILPWLLLVAAIALLRPGDGGVTVTDPVTYELTRDKGRGKVTGVTSPNDAIALRNSWRHAAEFSISGEAKLMSEKGQPIREGGKPLERT